MKKIILLFLLTLIYSCETKSQTVIIPNKVEIKNLENKIVVKGTRVLIDKSANYSYYNELKRFQKDQNNFFQVIEYIGQDCDAIIEKTSNKIDELQNKGGNIRVKKKFKLGEYNAYFGIAPQGETEQIFLVFGDKSFAVMVAGIYPNKDLERKEIMDLVLSSYYNKGLKVNVEDNLYYSVELNNSEFKISSVSLNIGTYTIGGEKLTDYSNNFVISTIPNSKDFDIKAYSDKLIYKYQNNIYKEKSINIKILSGDEYKEGENRIIKTEMLGELNGKKQKIYQFIKSTPKGIYLFIGTDFTENFVHTNEFKKIAKNISIK
ncbi:hypothetical protein [Flavobacterium sp. RSSB_23]|uniref:hypothetical protein n=1 Tax=Flavobacterium sp. RSSB_23 TaxID=3447668 RepID=UPI003F3E0EC9